MRRQIFTEEHDAFRDMVRAFIAKEIAPYHEQWERDGIVSRDVWLAAGRVGLLGIHLDEKYGGGGQPDYRFYVILNEELARAGFGHRDRRDQLARAVTGEPPLPLLRRAQAVQVRADHVVVQDEHRPAGGGPG